MLLFDKVTKKYDQGITALEDIDFSIDKGEFSFLVGPSGAGKTTLMRLLIREEIPTSGSIFFEDIEVPKLPRKLLPQYRQKLGIVFQDMKLLESKTLSENIEFALEILGKEAKEIKDTSEYLLELVKLQDRRNLFPNQLSGGEQQRGAIARALANNPELLIADEPTGNLDPDNAFDVLTILKNINKAGTTVMVISHDRDIVNQMKTRVIRIEKGKIISDNKGDYDTIKKPKVTSIKSKQEPKEEKKEEKEEKKEKELETDERLKGLKKDILEKLLKAKINTLELVFNLTENDLKNLKISKKEQEELEEFVKEYLNKSK
ncbi:ATP-binding cassette domain-containing protein [Candidatus Microgenomates bacterium]|nr:ATP-binding cassette domain-containing protein [Candidatus Microgenomates bacterium]